MNPADILKLAGLGAILAALMGGAALLKDYAKTKDELARQRICVSYLTSHGQAGSPAGCDPALLPVYHAAEDSRLCEAGLKLDAIAPQCPAYVQQLYGERADAQGQLAAAVADRDAAIARAENRVANATLRKQKDEDGQKLAQHEPDGLVTCDARCLRARFE